MAEAPAPRARRLGYEPKDVSARWVIVAAFGGSLFVAISAAALYGLQRLYATLDVVAVSPPPTALERRAPELPQPRLQAAPAKDFAAYRAREAAILDSYAWVDGDAGVVRIPIERAMELLAERGWPQPATGPRPPPAAVRGLEPWPDWREVGSPSGVTEGDLAPEQGEAGQ